MQDLKHVLNAECQKYVSLVVSMRSGQHRWLEVDDATGKKVDVTDAKLATFEETVRTLRQMIQDLDASDYLSCRPTKDWHFDA
ncbi:MULTISPECIES: hypothetical protein [unclassified Rhizobium]|jgi:hypothetical protein|uniref:hypothetical protein n=1 Tax=unclassified Rhizobium TaxID=2613769 RepID=UPI000271D39C|nr:MULTISPECIES: hypothetical protein [unclassified Rhizobium]EJL53128.1 hypothetical protein PMI09_03439 [Rhizobium sp. CF122]MBB3393868.1 hypothetical protein [Rhizobium sp. BK060]MBB4169151.1 hypothetical protein [Rhizobium sp. BK538]MBZ9789142.1 hypothetical protein [Rhizobium sp. 3T7]TCM71922.1 hypothetical protein EV291_12224 [Rhizobium sp. BK068]